MDTQRNQDGFDFLDLTDLSIKWFWVYLIFVTKINSMTILWTTIIMTFYGYWSFPLLGLLPLKSSIIFFYGRKSSEKVDSSFSYWLNLNPFNKGSSAYLHELKISCLLPGSDEDHSPWNTLCTNTWCQCLGTRLAKFKERNDYQIEETVKKLG